MSRFTLFCCNISWVVIYAFLVSNFWVGNGAGVKKWQIWGMFPPWRKIRSTEISLKWQNTSDNLKLLKNSFTTIGSFIEKLTEGKTRWTNVLSFDTAARSPGVKAQESSELRLVRTYVWSQCGRLVHSVAICGEATVHVRPKRWLWELWVWGYCFSSARSGDRDYIWPKTLSSKHETYLLWRSHLKNLGLSLKSGWMGQHRPKL